jgi:NADH-quinone oxidoreductase subunit J
MFGIVAGLVSVGAIVAIFLKSLHATSISTRESPSPQPKATPRRSANCLFTQYVLPFEVVSVLLLVAMIGVILLSKKDLK